MTCSVQAAVTPVKGTSAVTSVSAKSSSFDSVSGSGRQVQRRAAALRHSLIGQDKNPLADESDDDDNDDDYDDNAPLITFTAVQGRRRRGRPPKSAVQQAPSRSVVQQGSSKSVVQQGPSKSVVQPGTSTSLTTCIIVWHGTFVRLSQRCGLFTIWRHC